MDLNTKTNEELLALYRESGDLDIKQELTLRYLYIVKAIAVQMRDVYVGFTQIDDIINEGVIVLMKALDKYNFSKNAKFETYVSWRIRGMIIDIARKQALGPAQYPQELQGHPRKDDGDLHADRSVTRAGGSGCDTGYGPEAVQ